ncbi:MAG: DsrE family protein, partial [Actinomycetales bacterium]
MTPSDGDPAGSRNSLLIKVTAGSEAPDRCSQAFTVAGTAAASGVAVSLWLTGAAAWFAVPGRAEEFSLPHAASLADLRDAVLATGRITLCTQCAQRRGIEIDDLLPGVRMGGAAGFVFVAVALVGLLVG